MDRQTLQSEYDRMIAANKETVGRFTALEVIAVQRQIVALDLAAAQAQTADLRRAIQQPNEAVKRLTTELEEAQQRLDDARAAANAPNMLYSHNLQEVDRLQALATELAAHVRAVERGVTRTVRG